MNPVAHGCRGCGLPRAAPRFAVLVALAVTVTGCQSEAPKPRNLLLISIDTLNRSALRCYSPDALPLPALDSLAASSVRMLRAYSSASWTLPAHASIMTGLYPDRHQAIHRLTRIRRDVPQLGQVLREAGLHAVGFSEGGFVDGDFGFKWGFDRYDAWKNPERRRDCPPVPRNGGRSRVAGSDLFDRAIAYLESRAGTEEAFFLFVHTMMVHDYWQSHPWAVEGLAEYGDDADRYGSCLRGKRDCREEDWVRLRALYRAELKRLDEGIGRLLSALEESGHGDDTLIVFLTDHGEGFDPARGRIHHGGRLHEDVLHIPMLIAGPGISPGACAHPVSLVDVFPTIMDAFGLEPSSGLDSRSFWGAVLSPERRLEGQERRLFAMEHEFRWDGGRRDRLPEPPDAPLGMAVIQGDDWYIQAGDEVELYDMSSDPRQDRNLAASRHLEEFRRIVGARESSGRKPSTHELDEEQLDELRSLGYVD